MKKKILKILILIIIVFAIVITLFAIKHKTYNNIEENWIIKISPNYLKQPPNVVYLYEDSYIITNCYANSPWQNIVHKRGILSNKVNENLIIKMKEDATTDIQWNKLNLSVKLKSGEELTLTVDSEVINEIIDMIDYDGTIWYAQD